MQSPSAASPPILHRCRAFLLLALFCTGVALAQGTPSAAPAASPDVIVFTNGDQLSGKLLRSVEGTVTFHSDIAGDISVAMDRVKSIHTGGQFAVIRKGQAVSPRKPGRDIPQGTVEVTGGNVAVSSTSGTTQQVAAKDATYLIDEATFQKEVIHEPGFFYGWNGSITLGATTVNATQTSETFTGAATLVRIIPTVDWLNPRNKTLFDLSATYGIITQPGIAGAESASSAKTNILHGDAERDEYISSRAFLLVDASADHNLGSGLQLQQTYGGGAGVTVYKHPKQELDLKGDIHYQQQQFYPSAGLPTPTVNLIGASLNETYLAKLPHGLVFNESGTYLPAFNVPSAYSAIVLANLNFPVYRHFSFTLGTQDNYLNDPPAGFRNNSFQFTAGLSYVLKK